MCGPGAHVTYLLLLGLKALEQLLGLQLPLLHLLQLLVLRQHLLLLPAHLQQGLHLGTEERRCWVGTEGTNAIPGGEKGLRDMGGKQRGSGGINRIGLPK